jgi:hypothetical protein
VMALSQRPEKLGWAPDLIVAGFARDRRLASIWFQPTEAHDVPRQRWHLDLRIPRRWWRTADRSAPGSIVMLAARSQTSGEAAICRGKAGSGSPGRGGQRPRIPNLRDCSPPVRVESASTVAKFARQMFMQVKCTRRRRPGRSESPGVFTVNPF